MPFAEGTTVPVEKTRAEIEKVVMAAGAGEFTSALKPGGAAILFRMQERWVKFELAMPDRKDKRFTQDPRYTWCNRPEGKQQQLYDAEVRRLWRALLLVLKAKLEATKSGITTFETEFLAHIMMPGGQTVAQQVVPQIREAYRQGRMTQLMLGDGDTE